MENDKLMQEAAAVMGGPVARPFARPPEVTVPTDREIPHYGRSPESTGRLPLGHALFDGPRDAAEEAYDREFISAARAVLGTIERSIRDSTVYLEKLQELQAQREIILAMECFDVELAQRYLEGLIKAFQRAEDTNTVRISNLNIPACGDVLPLPNRPKVESANDRNDGTGNAI